MINLIRIRTSVALLLLLALTTLPAAAQDGHVFLLKREAGQLALEQVDIPNGEMRVFISNPETGVIDVIIPIGPGGSGSVAQTGQQHMITARNDGGTMKVAVQDASGNRHDYPERPMSELVKFDTRLSVIADDGLSASFRIDRYDRVYTDTVGPVMDLFGGVVPLQKGDYVLTSNTQRSNVKYDWQGHVPLEYHNGYLFTTVTGPDGRKGTFVVDIGAALSVVCESFLPKGTDITESYMIEYSAKGKRQLKYEPGGGTGPIRTVKGQATLPTLAFGDVTLTDVGVDVITSLPELRGTAIDGIIGMDIMRAAPAIRLEYGPHAGLTVGDALHVSAKTTLTLPFSRIGDLLYVKGAVSGTPVYFIMDSGSPSCVMPPASLQLTGAELKSDSAVTYKGGGGQQWEGTVGTIDGLSVGNQTFADQPFLIGDIHVLQRLGPNQASGLLGNSFFSQFAAMEIDFDDQVVRFTK